MLERTKQNFSSTWRFKNDLSETPLEVLAQEVPPEVAIESNRR
jgi:hypothetical protein